MDHLTDRGNAAVAFNQTENLPMLKNNNSPAPGDIIMESFYGSLASKS